MKSIKVACSGFPVGQKMYRSKLSVVELAQMFDGVPQNKTMERWRAEAGDAFEYIACVPEDVTTLQAKNRQRGDHRLGIFQDTPEVNATFRQTLLAATALKSKILVMRLPRAFAPSADNVERVLKFIQRMERGKLTLVWEPPTHWPASIVDGVTKRLTLVTAVNPLSGRPLAPSPIRYFRLGKGGHTGGVHSFTDAELARIKDACAGAVAYVIFNSGPRSFDDAVRFSSMIY